MGPKSILNFDKLELVGKQQTIELVIILPKPTLVPKQLAIIGKRIALAIDKQLIIEPAQQLVGAQLISLLPNIQLSQQHVLEECIRCICPSKLRGCIQFSTR